MIIKYIQSLSNFFNNKKIIPIFFSIFFLLFFFVKLKYSGNVSVLILFYLTYFLVISMIFFRYKSIFYTALALFWTLAFPIKFSLMILGNLPFFEPVGSFSYDAESFDRLLIASSMGGIGLILAKILLLKPKNFSNNLEKVSVTNENINKLNYEIFSYVILVLTLSLVNFNLHIFQVGILSKTILPYKLNFFFFLSFNVLIPIWLCSIINKLNKNIENNLIYAAFLICYTSLLISLSVLSRGSFIMIGLPLFITSFYAFKVRCIKWRYIISTIFIFISSFLVSLLLVSQFRAPLYNAPEQFQGQMKAQDQTEYLQKNLEILPYFSFNKPDEYRVNPMDLRGESSQYIAQLSSLVVNRWIGLEGVATAISYKFTGLPLFEMALMEPASSGSYGIYQILSNSPFALDNFANKFGYSFGVLPGFIGFLALSNSLLIILISTFLVAILIMALEKILFNILIKNIYLRIWFGVSMANSIMQFSQPISWIKWFVPLLICVILLWIIDLLIDKIKRYYCVQ